MQDSLRGTVETKPNIIWIFGDQHRGQATGYAGDPNVFTPNLDRMAANGMASMRAVGGCPLCCPFRGSLLTSRYPHECVPGHEFPMSEELPTVADAFKGAGYHTAYFGKWHVDGYREADGYAAMHIVPPHRRGRFDVWAGFDNNNSQWDSWVHGGEGDDAFHYRLPGYETDCLADMLIDYVEGRSRSEQEGKDEPFFAVMSVQPPHDPYVAPERWMANHNAGSIELRENVPNVPRVVSAARRDLAGYYAQIENLDWNVGRVLQALEDSGLATNTYVVFFSDHGDMHGSHGQFRKTCPHEESIRIPFILYHARYRYGHRHGYTDLPINHVDIAPTSLGLCGIEVPDWMRGTDYSGRFVPGREKSEEPDSAFLQLVVPTGHAGNAYPAWRAIVTNDGWKYACFNGMPWMLHNLNEDPYEQVNLAHSGSFRQDHRRLHERLRAWLADTGDDFVLPEI